MTDSEARGEPLGPQEPTEVEKLKARLKGILDAVHWNDYCEHCTVKFTELHEEMEKLL